MLNPSSSEQNVIKISQTFIWPWQGVTMVLLSAPSVTAEGKGRHCQLMEMQTFLFLSVTKYWYHLGFLVQGVACTDLTINNAGKFMFYALYLTRFALFSFK